MYNRHIHLTFNNILVIGVFIIYFLFGTAVFAQKPKTKEEAIQFADPSFQKE